MSDFDHEDDSSVLSEPPSDIPPSSSDSETGLLSEPGTDSEDQLSGNPLFKKLK